MIQSVQSVKLRFQYRNQSSQIVHSKRKEIGKMKISSNFLLNDINKFISTFNTILFYFSCLIQTNSSTNCSFFVKKSLRRREELSY